MPSVYITRKIPQPGIDILKEAGFDITKHESDEAIKHEVLVDALKATKYDALLCMLTDQIDMAVFEAAGPQLKIISTMSVGYEHIDLQGCRSRNILATNTPGVSTDAVAELTVSLLLMTARRLSEGVAAARSGEWGLWKPMWLLGTQLTNKTLGIYGLGRIGFGVGARLKPFGFSKIYYHDVNQVPYAKDIEAEYIDFKGLLKNCDFICICCNLTDENRHIFNRESFKTMKKEAIIVNSGRGGVIDHDALYEALESRTINSAGLDVTEPEPLPVGHPLLKCKYCNVVPHMGSNTWDSRNEMSALAAKNVVAGVKGEDPIGLIKV